MVFSGLVTAWRFARIPTKRRPSLSKETIEGVVLLPSLLGITFGDPPYMKETTEFVVPRSIPIIFLAMISPLFFENCYMENSR